MREKLTVGIDFLDELVEDLLVEGLTHESEDVGDHVGGDATALLPVEAVESLAEHCNIIGIYISSVYHF